MHYSEGKRVLLITKYITPNRLADNKENFKGLKGPMVKKESKTEGAVETAKISTVIKPMAMKGPQRRVSPRLAN